MFTRHTATFFDLPVDKLHKRVAFEIGSSLLPAHEKARAVSVPSATGVNASVDDEGGPFSNDALFAPTFAQILC